MILSLFENEVNSWTTELVPISSWSGTFIKAYEIHDPELRGTYPNSLYSSRKKEGRGKPKDSVDWTTSPLQQEGRVELLVNEVTWLNLLMTERELTVRLNSWTSITLPFFLLHRVKRSLFFLILCSRVNEILSFTFTVSQLFSSLTVSLLRPYVIKSL